MITIGLIGGTGQLGLCLQDVARTLDDVCIVHFDRDQVNLVFSESENAVAEIAKTHACNVMINAAAYTQVDLAENDMMTAFKTNWHGPALLAKICAEQRIPLIQISTDYVFDGLKKKPYVESDAPNPLSIYGLSKLAGEMAVSALQPHSLIVRTAWMFSPYRKNFLKTMVGMGQKQDELRIVSDQTGTPTYAYDLADALIVAAREIIKPGFQDWGVFHYAGDEPTTWFQYAQEIFKVSRDFGFKVPKKVAPIAASEYPLPATRPAYSALLSQKFTAVFDVPPSRWRSGVRETVKQIQQGEASSWREKASS